MDWDDELLEAVENGVLIKVQIALENGADPDARDVGGDTVLYVAAKKVMLRLSNCCLSMMLTQTLKIFTVVRHCI
jgi:ankyrin repeat protein